MKYFKAIIISSIIVYKWITTQDSAKYMVVFNMFEIRNYVKHAK